MDEIKVINPFKEGKHFWLGLEEEGLRRKVFRVIDEELINSDRMVVGLTIFEPGEGCAPHSHPGSEEFNYAVRGGGIAIDVTHSKETRFKTNEFIFIPDGVEHVHFNDGEEPLWLLWAYAPPGEMPTR